MERKDEMERRARPGDPLRTLHRLPTLLALLALLALPVSAQPHSALAAAVEAVLDDAVFADAYWGVLVQDLDSGATLVERDADKRFIPASNQKLVTTAAALALLGPDHRYTTRLYRDGPVRDGVLEGDLVIRGDGDPTFGDPDDDPLAPFVRWADALRALGVTRITGDVVGDDDVFDDVPYGLGWSWDDLTYGYGAEVSGLQFHVGTVDLDVRGTRPGAPGRLTWSPLLTDYVEFVNRSVTRGRDTSIREGYARELSGNRFVVTTAVPAGGRETERLAVHNPTRYAAHTLRLVLLRRGIQVDGEAVDVDDRAAKPDYGTLVEVARHASPPLAEIVAVTNTESQNLFAEHLLRTLGTRPVESDALPGSAEAGVAAMTPFLDAAGIDPAGLRLIDGSGLSFMNRVTPRQIVRILAAMDAAEPAVRAAFFDSLPRGGETGTLTRRFRSGMARGNVRAKTGYINGVRTLSGTVTTTDGRRLAFALLCNGYGVSTGIVNDAQDRIVELLAASGGN